MSSWNKQGKSVGMQEYLVQLDTYNQGLSRLVTSCIHLQPRVPQDSLGPAGLSNVYEAVSKVDGDIFRWRYYHTVNILSHMLFCELEFNAKVDISFGRPHIAIFQRHSCIYD